ncbi:MAG: PilC/PilY family type IV pilus protein [Marinagarivorans sp.]|nr:PilC/PilY family type IV pilus protein [Marinagarivorans sp.]
MLECYRYYAGATGPTSDFNADDTSVITGLKTQTTWSNPQDATSACAHLNLIAFNTSTVSYDGDNLAGVSGLNTTKTANQLTNEVGAGEGINGNYFFVGSNGGSGTDNNQLCTAKKVDELGTVKGICPNAPRLEGTYNAAGIAYHARTVDLRTDIPDRQNVSTYGVALAPALPSVSLMSPSTGKKITILPACRNDSVKGNCGLVDFKVISQTVTSTEVSGSFYVNWEDSEQGGDYDQDMSGVLKYELTSTGIKITTQLIAESTIYKMGFGFVISGTTADGFHSLSGIEGYSLYGCTNCQVGNEAKSKNFTLGSSTVAGAKVSLLEAPLFYASKWGGFNDVNGNGKPDLAQEWDRKNNHTGAFGADGIPDTYFFAVNPQELKKQLTAILVDILERTAAGTAASVVSNTGAGEGALYQALYNPRTADKKGENFIDWVGTLNALFIDRYGFMREDSAAPFGTLSNADNIVKVFYDEGARRTRIQRYAFNQGGQQGTVLGVAVDVSQIKPIWSAHKALAQVGNYTTQRTNYGDLASSARYILTGIDTNGDSLIVGGGTSTNEVVPFTSDIFSDASAITPNYRLLGIENVSAATATTNATNIVNFVRGKEGITGFRSRSLDVEGNGTLMPWLLGDIVHSSPVSVGRAAENYDVTFGDETYRLFRQKYQSRRQVVYVGSNDGMLHAFNGGFYNSDDSSYSTSKNGETAHPLGSELWAYVPYNALPHLQWLTQPNYPHVYYVDGPVKAFDVNIFDADADHPGGWGTIIVGSMRLGGGEYALDPNSDPDGDSNDDIKLRSSYFVFDVTNPEVPPKLLIEFTDTDLGYALSEPTVVKTRTVGVNGDFTTPGQNDWYLMFGSGPQGSDPTTQEEALRLAQSSEQAQIYAINLKTLDLIKKDTGVPKSFVGGVTGGSWTRKYSDDAVYFGLVEGLAATPKGRLLRGVLPDVLDVTKGLPFSPVIGDYSQPFSATPLLQRDLTGNTWIFAGTGRFLVVEDNFTAAPQSYYAVKEFDDVSTKPAVSKAALVNTTDIETLTNGDLLYQRNDVSILLNTGETVETFAQLSKAVEDHKGWYFNFKRTRGRNTTKATVADQSLVFTEYQPSGLQCEPEGNGFLHTPHMFVGVAAPFAPLGTDSSVKSNDAELVLGSVNLGFGSPSTPYIHLRVDGSRAAIVQTSTGEISWTKINSAPGKGARQSWRELEITW